MIALNGNRLFRNSVQRRITEEKGRMGILTKNNALSGYILLPFRVVNGIARLYSQRRTSGVKCMPRVSSYEPSSIIPYTVTVSIPTYTLLNPYFLPSSPFLCKYPCFPLQISYLVNVNQPHKYHTKTNYPSHLLDHTGRAQLALVHSNHGSSTTDM